jgi:hypothetical protein
MVICLAQYQAVPQENEASVGDCVHLLVVGHLLRGAGASVEGQRAELRRVQQRAAEVVGGCSHYLLCLPTRFGLIADSSAFFRRS